MPELVLSLVQEGECGQLFHCKPVMGASRNQLWFYVLHIISAVQVRVWTVDEGDLLSPWLQMVCAEQESHHVL